MNHHSFQGPAVACIRRGSFAGRLASFAHTLRFARSNGARYSLYWPRVVDQQPEEGDYAFDHFVDVSKFRATFADELDLHLAAEASAELYQPPSFADIRSIDGVVRTKPPRTALMLEPEEIFLRAPKLLVDEHVPLIRHSREYPRAVFEASLIFKSLPLNPSIERAVLDLMGSVQVGSAVAVHLRRGKILDRLDHLDPEADVRRAAKRVAQFHRQYLPDECFHAQLAELGNPPILVYSDSQRAGELFRHAYAGECLDVVSQIGALGLEHKCQRDFVEYLLLGKARAVLGASETTFSKSAAELSGVDYMDVTPKLRAADIWRDINHILELETHFRARSRTITAGLIVDSYLTLMKRCGLAAEAGELAAMAAPCRELASRASSSSPQAAPPIELLEQYRPCSVREAAESCGVEARIYCEPGKWFSDAKVVSCSGTMTLSVGYRIAPMAIATFSDVMLVDGCFPVVDNQVIYPGMHHNAEVELERLFTPLGAPTENFYFRTRAHDHVSPRTGLSFLLGGVKDNFWHFLYNVVLRLSYLCDAEDNELRETAPIVITSDLPRAFRPFIEALGFDPWRIVEVSRKHAARFERLAVGEMPYFTAGGRLYAAPLATRFIQTRLPISDRPWRRIYISRRDARWRRVLNESLIVETLERLGFELIELQGMRPSEIITLFRQAEIVVGASGANLGAVLFCQPGTHVVELTYPPYVEKYYFQGGSSMGGLIHSKVVGVPVCTAQPDHTWDFEVDHELLRRWLCELI
jgi:hypothetical protein